MGFWLLYQLFPQSFIQGWQWQLSFFLNRIYWIYLNVFMINSMHCALPSHLKRQTSQHIPSFTPTSSASGFRAHQGSCSPADGRREPSSEERQARRSSVPRCRASAASEHPLLPKNRIRSEMRTWTMPSSKRYHFIHTDTPPHPTPPKYPAVKRSR